jgi:hypothetical protein
MISTTEPLLIQGAPEAESRYRVDSRTVPQHAKFIQNTDALKSPKDRWTSMRTAGIIDRYLLSEQTT